MRKRLHETIGSTESTSDDDLHADIVFSTSPSGPSIQFTHVIGQSTKKTAIDDLYDLLDEENNPSNLGF